MRNKKIKNKILILAPYTSLPGETSFSRFLYLAQLFSEKHDVILLTSSFHHKLKKQRNNTLESYKNLPFRIILINEPGYSKNVGAERWISHHYLTKNIEKWLKAQEKGAIDLIYSGFPLISTNLMLNKYKKKLNYKIIIDVQDIWPDSFTAVVPILKKYPFLLSPIRRFANKAYCSADGLIAVSKTYLEVAIKQNSKVPAMYVYIGADKLLIDSIVPQKKDYNKVKLLYMGTLSYSYDVATVIKSVNKLHLNDSSIELHIVGNGPNLLKLRKLASNGIFFHGLLPYSEMISFAKSCDILVNSITNSAQQSVTNKLSDYLLLRLPIINSQTMPEVKSLLKQTVSTDYVAGQMESCSEAILKIIKRVSISKNQQNHIELERLFNRRITYPKIVDFCLKILNK